MTTTRDGKFRIDHVVISDRSSYMDADTSYEFQLVSTATEKVIMSWRGRESSDSTGTVGFGVKDVTFHGDSQVLVTFHDGKATKKTFR